MPEIDRDEARRRFGAARIARLATVDVEGRPHLVPVVFARREDVIVMAVDGKPKRSQALKRLRNIEVNPPVCLLADGYDEDWNRLWWARADGAARVLPPDAVEPETRDEYTAAIALLWRKYAQYRERSPDGPVTVVTVQRWSGWRAASGNKAAGPAG